MVAPSWARDVCVLALVVIGCGAPNPPVAGSLSPTPRSEPTAEITSAPTLEPTEPTIGATPNPTVRTSPTPATAGPPLSTATLPPFSEIDDELFAPGVLTACVAVVGSPAASLDEEGRLVGYNVSFAAEIAKRLHLELETRSPLFEDLIETLLNHECDVSVSSQNITSERQQLIAMAAYTESIQPVLVPLGNPRGISALTDLCGLGVSATDGTTHVDLVIGAGEYVGRGLDDGCVAAGRPPIALQAFDTETEAITQLLEGDVDAYLGNPSFAEDFPDQIESAPATLPPARQGIATAPDRPALGSAVTATLNEMFADGTYRAILNQHLPGDESIRRVSVLE